MSLDGVVPVTDIKGAAGTEADVDRNEAEVCREDNVTGIFLLHVVTRVDPLVKLHPVGGLVAHLDKTTLHFSRESIPVDEFLAARS